MRRTKSALAAVTPGIAALLLLAACSEGNAPEGGAPAPSPSSAASSAASAPTAEEEAADLVAEGRAAYLGNCIACHNPDPTQDGALGPALAGSSEDLVQARVMRAEYPPGYPPKRDTRSMIPMPFLEKKIPAIAAYLSSVGPRS